MAAAPDLTDLAGRIEAVVNKKYKKSGIESYVWLLQKCMFAPTATHILPPLSQS